MKVTSIIFEIDDVLIDFESPRAELLALAPDSVVDSFAEVAALLR